MEVFGVKFDLICSFGENCACAMLLNDAGFRMASYPFDWTGSYSLEQNVCTLTSRFSHFMKRENIVWKEAGRADRANDVYCDTCDKHYYVHDFPKGMTLDESFPLVKAKYARRIDRLLKYLDGGRSVCLVWREIGDGASDEACETAIRQIRQEFPRSDVRLLVLKDDPAMDVATPFTVTQLADGFCVKAVGRIFANGFDPMIGNRKPQLRILNRLRCSTRLMRQRRAHAFRRAVVRFISLWHFSREGRKLSRKRWTQRLCRKGSAVSIGW